MNPLVSVAMTTFNGEKYLREQVASILNQTYPHLELVIADDVSTDGTWKLIQELSAEDSRIRGYQNKKNIGFAGNFLSAMSACRGEYLFFSDQDDRWEPEKVRILKDLLEKDEKCMLAYSDLEVCDESLKGTHASFWKAAGISPREGFLGEKSLLRNLAPGCSTAFRRIVADRIGTLGGGPPFVHDHLVFAVASCMGSVAYSRQRLVKYRQHPSNNIGAFYPSVMDRAKFVGDLKRKIDALKPLSLESDKVSLKKLERFCAQWSSDRIAGDPSFLPYFLFLRNDTPKDKLMGLFECVLPGIYQGLRRRRK